MQDSACRFLTADWCNPYRQVFGNYSQGIQNCYTHYSGSGLLTKPIFIEAFGYCFCCLVENRTKFRPLSCCMDHLESLAVLCTQWTIHGHKYQYVWSQLDFYLGTGIRGILLYIFILFVFYHCAWVKFGFYFRCPLQRSIQLKVMLILLMSLIVPACCRSSWYQAQCGLNKMQGPKLGPFCHDLHVKHTCFSNWFLMLGIIL